MVGGEFHPATGWTSTMINEATTDAPALAFTAANSALTVIRSTAGGGEIRFGTWSPGSFSAFAALAPGVTTRAAPALVGGGGVADLVFHGDNFKHYYAQHQMVWAPAAEPVGGAAAQSFGPSPAALAALAADRVACFAGGNGDLYDQTRSAGAWGGASGHALGDVVSLSPAMVTLGVPGLELLVVFVNKTSSKIYFTTRAAGLWSVPAILDATSFTADPVALTATAGGAVAAFRGLDQKIYFSRFSPAVVPPWSPPAPLAQPNPMTPAPPALAPGVGGFEAELAFASASDGLAYHCRLNAQGWSAPVGVGGAMITRVALTSAP
jgi:hypothetical protein